MLYKIKNIFNRLHYIPIAIGICLFCCSFVPSNSLAATSVVDKFDLSPFIPWILDAFMKVASALYDFFVGKGNGIIYIFIWAIIGFYLALYSVKMYLPKNWLSFFGFSDGGEIWEGKATGWTIGENVFKPIIRAIVAATILLQIKPIYVTDWLVNPFLEFGAIYTSHITKSFSHEFNFGDAPKCPESVIEKGWISQSSCNFLVQPVYHISRANNQVIKKGFDFLKQGLRGLMKLIPHGGENLLNIITGILLIAAFVSSNVFMALLIIQAIFNFGIALVLYPFNVVAWVAKKSDKWLDVLPAFSTIIDSLKKLIITMIACAFILCINIAVVHALFQWSSSIFVVAAGGSATSNVPQVANATLGFGQHSVLWISSLLTFFLMQSIFNLTKERLELYTAKSTDKKLYNKVTSDAEIMYKKVKATPQKIKDIIDVATGLKEKLEKKK